MTRQTDSNWTRQSIELAIPAALPHLLESILASRVGPEAVISTSALKEELQSRGLDASDRSIRAAVRELRRFGMLICSSPSGYFLATSLIDVEDFLAREIESRAHDLLQTAREMREAAKIQFGAAQQAALF